MKDGQMITAMARVEGFELTYHLGVHLRKDNQGDFCINGVTMGRYNPIMNGALTFKAFVDYGLEKEGNVYHIGGNPDTCANCMDKGDGYAVIECILKSKGMWEY